LEGRILVLATSCIAVFETNWFRTSMHPAYERDRLRSLVRRDEAVRLLGLAAWAGQVACMFSSSSQQHQSATPFIVLLYRNNRRIAVEIEPTVALNSQYASNSISSWTEKNFNSTTLHDQDTYLPGSMYSSPTVHVASESRGCTLRTHWTPMICSR
jgi:hypothetical protein